MKKTFDCVKMMRDIREQLSKRYAAHPELLEQDMAEIHRKHGFPDPLSKSKPRLLAEEPTSYGGKKKR